jgi:hypothetical protein
MHEEVLSTPTEPFLCMRFDTVEAARVHYNAYAAKPGFSVKSHTSQRNRHINTLEKQQFVCNKFRKSKTDEELQRERMNIIEEVSPVQMDEENSEEGHAEDDEAGPSKRSSSRLAVKPKRETIKQTSCRARMFVKLINNKWEVTYFIAEHNHPMINKPSLTKYLRSHRGIPQDEREFLRCLHNCNLQTGLSIKPKTIFLFHYMFLEVVSIFVRKSVFAVVNVLKKCVCSSRMHLTCPFFGKTNLVTFGILL